MITDNYLRLATAQAVTTTPVITTNTYDLAQAREIGSGHTVVGHFTVTTAFTSATEGAFVTFELVTSPQTTFAANSIAAASVNFADDELTIASHGLPDGTAVYWVQVGTLPTGLTASRIYYTKSTGTNTFKLYTDRDLGTVVDITNAGTGSNNLFVLPTVVGSSGPIPTTALKAVAASGGGGTIVKVRANALPATPQYRGGRYLSGRIVGSTVSAIGTTLAGAFTLDVGLEGNDDRKFYPSGFTVS